MNKKIFLELFFFLGIMQIVSSQEKNWNVSGGVQGGKLSSQYNQKFSNGGYDFNTSAGLKNGKISGSINVEGVDFYIDRIVKEGYIPKAEMISFLDKLATKYNMPPQMQSQVLFSMYNQIKQLRETYSLDALKTLPQDIINVVTNYTKNLAETLLMYFAQFAIESADIAMTNGGGKLSGTSHKALMEGMNIVFSMAQQSISQIGNDFLSQSSMMFNVNQEGAEMALKLYSYDWSWSKKKDAQNTINGIVNISSNINDLLNYRMREMRCVENKGIKLPILSVSDCLNMIAYYRQLNERMALSAKDYFSNLENNSITMRDYESQQTNEKYIQQQAKLRQCVASYKSVVDEQLRAVYANYDSIKFDCSSK